MKQKKLTQEQRIGRLERVASEAWFMCKMLQKEIGILQNGIKKDEEE